MSAIVPRSLPRSPAASRTGSFSSMGIAPLEDRAPVTETYHAVGAAAPTTISRRSCGFGVVKHGKSFTCISWPWPKSSRRAACGLSAAHRSRTASDRFLLSSVLAGISLRTCGSRVMDRVFLFGPNSPSGSDLWKLYVAFAAIGSLNSDTNPWRCICSRRPWESSRGKNRRRSGYVSVLNARSRWPWGLPPRARLTLPHGT